MNFTKTASVEELQVISRFESLRKILLSEQYADHLKKPLAYWALPTDRRLPLAFLGRTLEDLLQTPFSELSNTPGIGQKKICSFVKLLARAANTDPSELPTETIALPTREAEKAEGDGESANGFNPASVSEVVWGQWRASVTKHGLGSEKLGRFAPTLRNMTRVIWNTPLEAYTRFDLGEIRSMKTHGEKRVRAILEVFHSIHVLVANMGTQDHLVLRIFPRLIDRVEQWIGHVLQTQGVPTTQELFENVVGPLLEQVRNDATQQIASLAENRLGISGPITSVRQAARAMGLTRRPRLSVAQRDQRHYGGAVAERPAPDVRAPREGRHRVAGVGICARLPAVLRRHRVVLSRQSPRRRRSGGTDNGRGGRRSGRGAVGEHGGRATPGRRTVRAARAVIHQCGARSSGFSRCPRDSGKPGLRALRISSRFGKGLTPPPACAARRGCSPATRPTWRRGRPHWAGPVAAWHAT